jgi:hypothetical protein
VKESRAKARALDAEIATLPCDATTIQEINRFKGKASSLRQSILSDDIEKHLQLLLRWTLSAPDSNPVTLTVSARQEAVYRLGELATASPQKRAGPLFISCLKASGRWEELRVAEIAP